MFDVSLSELMIVGIVALIVIGPERLPRVARTMGHLLGRLQRYVGQVKSDINREMQLDDLKKFQAQMADEASKLKSSFTDVGDELRSVETSLNASVMAAAGEGSKDGMPSDGVSPAPTGENALPPQSQTSHATFPQSLSREGRGKDSAPLAETQMDADNWKLPDPLPESAIPSTSSKT